VPFPAHPDAFSGYNADTDRGVKPDRAQRTNGRIAAAVTSNALFRLFEGLPRQAPGGATWTRTALARLPPLPHGPQVVDVACGTGASTLVLAETLRTRSLAIDLHEPYLEQLRQRAQRKRLGHLIETRVGDMRALDLEPGSVDLLWCEGAAYILGFAEALRLWRPLLAPRGLVVISDCAWLSADRPRETVAFWAEDYPTMASIGENVERARAAGYRVLDRLTLPPSAWWDDFYTPLLERMTQLRPGADAELRAAIDAMEHEIGLFRRHPHAYGYVFYIMRLSG